MKIKWLLGIDLEDDKVFSKIEKLRNCKLTAELRKFITSYNAASPDHYNFRIRDKVEVFGAVLNFNENGVEGSNVFDALKVVTPMNLVPFGIDPFGNYVCYDSEMCNIVFWEHEQEKTIYITGNIVDFVDMLF